MSRIVQDVTVNRPPQDVWAYITDFARGPDWIPGQLEKQALTPAPYGPGTRIRAVQKVPGRTVAGTFEIAGWQPLDPTSEIGGRGLYKLVELLTARSISGSLPAQP